ncbi:hypothetical protein C8R47DRAFT_400461 [Mycena vitilis]|nr:hypothetical protein C8R47DRAFT_400461 [Mycena vitilis]
MRKGGRGSRRRARTTTRRRWASIGVLCGVRRRSASIGFGRVWGGGEGGTVKWEGRTGGEGRSALARLRSRRNETPFFALQRRSWRGCSARIVHPPPRFVPCARACEVLRSLEPAPYRVCVVTRAVPFGTRCANPTFFLSVCSGHPRSALSSSPGFSCWRSHTAGSRWPPAIDAGQLRLRSSHPRPSRKSFAARTSARQCARYASYPKQH